MVNAYYLDRSIVGGGG